MLSILSVILRRKGTVILLCAAAFVISILISLMIPPRYYVSVAFIPVGVEQEITGHRSFFSQLGAFGEAYATFVRVRRNFVVDYIIRSRRMSDLVAEQFGLEEVYGASGREEVRRILNERTSSDVRDEGVIVLGVEDRNPERAKGLVEAYVHYLDSLLIELAVENAAGKRRFLESEIVRREARVASVDSAIMAFLDDHGVFEIEQQARAALNVAAILNARLSIMQVEKNLLEMTLKSGSPELEGVKRRLEKLEEQLLAVKEGTGAGLFPSLDELPDLAAGYFRLVGERRMQEFALTYIRIKLEEEIILANRRVSVIRVIDPPVLPERRIWPKRKQIVIVSTMAVFFWACFFLIIIERWRDGTLRLELLVPEDRTGGASKGDIGG